MEEKLSTDLKLMALISHLSILIPNIGIMAPVIIWATSRKRSNFVRFHALQSIFFQLIFFILMMFFIIVGIIMMLSAILWTALHASTEPGMLFFLSMFFMFMYFPLWIIFGVYAVVASVKSYRGKIFKYAIIGKIIERKVYKG